MYDYYALLGVPRFFATQDEIKAAYIEQVRFFHPDAANVSPEIALERTQLLNEAYYTLSDINRKRSYDEHLYTIIQQRQNKQTSNCEENEKRSTEEGRKRETSFPFGLVFRLLSIAAIISVVVISALDTESQNSKNAGRNNTQPQSAIEQVKEDPDAGLTKRNRPSSGTTLHWTGGYADAITAPLEIKTGATSSEDYFVKVCRVGDTLDYMAFYIRGGESAECEVPLGTYEIKYACGETWYGVNDLFGSKTSYAKADDTFRFYEEDGYVNGWTIELYLQTNGNLETMPISAFEF